MTAQTLPWQGVDYWNCFELSRLLPSGKPVVAIGEFAIPADSPNIIESKSFKLYLNSLNQTVSPPPANCRLAWRKTCPPPRASLSLFGFVLWRMSRPRAW